MGPPFVGPADDPVSTYFLSANRNEESVTADLKSEDGKELLTRLVERTDVLLENFRTGVLDRLGFSVERLHEINPRLVVLSITGFGHDGPEGGRAGYDQIAQGEAGLMSLTGPSPDEPTRVGVPIADLLALVVGVHASSRAPGGRSPARSRTASATTIRRSPPMACSELPTPRSRSRAAPRSSGVRWHCRCTSTTRGSAATQTASRCAPSWWR